MIDNFSNNEELSSVRGKLNQAIDGVNEWSQGAITRESNEVIFSSMAGYIIGKAAPRSGNVTYDFTDAKEGSVTMMIHEDATSFTLPANSVILSQPDDLSVAVNYIYFMLVDATASNEVVHVTISQEDV